MTEDEDDFVDLSPARSAATISPIVFSTITLRGGVDRVSLSFSEAAISRLEGWPRFSIAWSAKTNTFRIRAEENGPFEAYKTQRGERYILRIALPRELKQVDKMREPAPHRYGEDGRTLFIIVPPAFRIAPKVVTQSTHAQHVAAARAAVPAPSFGSTRK